MKSLIQNILISSLFLISVTSCATAQPTSGDQTISMKVYGLCDDCKLRIETAAMDSKGVKKAEWDKQSNTLVVIGSSKMTKEKIAESVAKAGYKSEIMEADPKGYAKLPGCCQYVSDEDKH